MEFVDAAGQSWEIVDFRTDVLRAKKKRVPLGTYDAEGRAFVPLGRAGTPMLCEFGRVAYRDLSRRTLTRRVVGVSSVERGFAGTYLI